jgi:DNA-directed RNA polymerase subunit M/transcription elongation factor TFIIS
MVKFCQKCGNMYNHVIDEDGIFVYHCLLCGNVDKVSEQCIIVNELNRNSHDYQINGNMIHDMTLSRTKTLKCQNPKCSSNQVGTQLPEIIMYQYNPELLNIGYMCTICQNHWKN